MTNAFRRMRPVFLAFVAAMAAACASTAGGSSSSFGPGDTVEHGGTAYRMLQVDQDFVLMRHRDPEGEAGGISGFVDEVFRIPRYRLGEGRWTSDLAPGVALQWKGLESFALVKDEATAPAPAPASEVVQADPAAAGQ